MKRRPVRCDACGQPIEGLAHAQVLVRVDRLGIVAALAVVHDDERVRPQGDAELVERRGAAAFLDERSAAELRDVGRYLGVSASRVLRRVRALAALSGAGVPA